MTTLTISLPDSLKEFVEAEVRTKGYGNVSEYVRGLLREAQAKEGETRLEALLLEALSKGKDIDVSPDFWKELRRDAAKILGDRRTREKVRARR
jgi:antitoxin ParD1/3/4